MKTAIDVGKILREVIYNENIPEVIIPIKQMSPEKNKKEKHIFIDENNIEFYIGSEYLGNKVYGLVQCTRSNKQTLKSKSFEIDIIYPITEGNKIIHPSGIVSILSWSDFKNKYKFSKLKLQDIEINKKHKNIFTPADLTIKNKEKIWECIESDEDKNGFIVSNLYKENKKGNLVCNKIERLDARLYNNTKHVKIKFKRK